MAIIMKPHGLFFLLLIQQSFCLVPPKFQWKSIDYIWNEEPKRNDAVKKEDYIPENNMPTGIVRWKDKLFVTIPRLKKGVPSSLNYVYLNGSQEQPLNPYPSWVEGFIPHNACCAPKNSSVVCAFRAYVDSCDRLWVVDNGMSDIIGKPKQISDPAIFVFDLNNDSLLRKHMLDEKLTRESSVFNSIVVEIMPSKGKDKDKQPCACGDAYAYITDMGSNALLVYNYKDNETWRFENPYCQFDSDAGKYKIGGVDFFWNDGVSSAALSNQNSKGFRDLYFHPTSSTKQFKVSTKLLKNKTTTEQDIFKGVQVIGDKGPMSQATACDFDSQNNILFCTQLSKNGVSCWNTNKPFNEENTPVILSDCNVMEFPNDVKVDQESNIWLLSNRQSRFLYGDMDFEDVNFRVLTSPISEFIKGTACEKVSSLSKAFGFMSRNKPNKSSCSEEKCKLPVVTHPIEK